MIRRLPILFIMIAIDGLAQSSISCTVTVVDGEPRVAVIMPVPHADKVLITTPDQRRIYLRDADTPIQHPDTDDFVNMREFVLDTNSRGTWFNDWGETEVVTVLGQSGSYELIVADNLERRNAATATNSCTFSLE
ncbi:MAG: hypothetical protein ACR2Q3_12600 [Woeseiaceae bacterium]